MNKRSEVSNRLLDQGLASLLLGWIPDRQIKVASGWLFLVLVIGSWAFVLLETDPANVLQWQNLTRGLDFIGELISMSPESAFRDPESWSRALQLTYDTLAMSVLAIGMAGLAILVTVVPGARSTAEGRLTFQQSLLGRAVFLFIRATYVFSRSVPELFWAMIIVFIFEPGIFAAALALAIHNYGILGKLCSEVVEDLDLRPVHTLRTHGAGIGQLLIVGILPRVLPKFLTYLFYRWEDIIRTTIVVGFVAAGGLGHQFRLSMSYFHYSEVGLLLLCYLLLVLLVDLVSGTLRGLIKL